MDRTDPRSWPTGRLLSAAARGVEREWDDHLSSWGLGHAGLPVLVVLSARDLSQRELAAAMRVTEQTMSKLVSRLDRLDYVRRAPHPSDRRRHVISLTELGRGVVREAADPGVSEAISTRGLTAEQGEHLRELLAVVVRARRPTTLTEDEDVDEHADEQG